MGHERVGELPKTQRWRDIVGAMGTLQGQAGGVAQIARQTTENIRSQFSGLQRDEGVLAAFKFLVALAVASRSPAPEADLAKLGIELPDQPTPLTFVSALQEWVDARTTQPEYSHLAKSAATDAIATWYEQKKPSARTLFETVDGPYDIWRVASTGAGFCELSRIFFGKFTERYLSYFLDREASAALPSIQERDRFAEQLHAHVEGISQHAFELAKITQSFAAGWFNKHAKDGVPTDKEIRGFISIALGKLRDELGREGVQE